MSVMGDPLDFLTDDGWPYPDQSDGPEPPDPVELRFDVDDDLVCLHALPPRAFAPLTRDEQAALTCRFGLDGSEPMTLDAVHATLGLSRYRVRCALADGITKLRRALSDGV